MRLPGAEAAVHVDQLSGHVTGLDGAEEQHDIRDFVRISHPSGHDELTDPALETRRSDR